MGFLNETFSSVCILISLFTRAQSLSMGYLTLKNISRKIIFVIFQVTVYWKDVLIEYGTNFDGHGGFVLLLVMHTSASFFPNYLQH